MFEYQMHTWDKDENVKALGALEWTMAVNNHPSWNLK